MAQSTFKTANGGTANTISGAFTVAAGTNRLLVVGIGSVPSNAVSSVTFNGVALTKLSQIANGTATKAEIWYLLAPPEVTANVVVNWTGTVEAAVGVANYTNVDQNNPFGTVVTNTVNGAGNFSLAVPSNAGDIAFDVVSSTSNTAHTAATQTPIQNSIFGAGTNSVKVSSSWRDGQATSTNMAWTASNTSNWSGIGVALKGFSNNDAVFTLSPALCQNFTVKSAQTITIKTHVKIATGSIPNPAAVRATLSSGGTAFFTSTSATWSIADSSLTWTGTIPTDVTINAGQTIALLVESDLTTTTFSIRYDAQTKPSAITLPTSTYINVGSIAVYNAAYPGGSVITSSTAGQVVYVRSTVTDPFGSSDITSEEVIITDPSSGVTTNNASVVNTNAATCSKIYEYAWTVPAAAGTHTVQAKAYEGTEGVTHTNSTNFNGSNTSKVIKKIY